MNLDAIIEVFKDRNASLEGKFRRFSVLVPLIMIKDEIHILFEVRSDNLKTQPGEICFPGGGIENNETPADCAIRETCEELGVSKQTITLLGECDNVVTPFNLILYPYVGILENVDIETIKFNKAEVASIFTVPLDYFINTPPHKYHVDTSLNIPSDFPYDKIQNGKGYNWRTGVYSIVFYEYKDYVIWGMTGRIIENFVSILKEQFKSK